MTQKQIETQKDISNSVILHAESCNQYHTVATFALLVDASPNTIRKWIELGMPYSKKVKRVPCQKAREWIEAIEA